MQDLQPTRSDRDVPGEVNVNRATLGLVSALVLYQD
jgi:hypothetical protein